ncbi:hypothetical protein LWI28_016946 [Acer negundo]|uniref:non-specific serine/threonine protein kinase n=1 Tax=Acer negundo TaxID=4023 RepID=A0AAD5J097_ACENE|nr:hypothetical protein LWI28_016946 [Acer negundo]
MWIESESMVTPFYPWRLKRGMARSISFTSKTCIFIFLIICYVPFCCARDTITLNASISDGETIISAGEIFELGFFNPVKGSVRRYLGIWYYKSDPKTVVWVANRDNPLFNTNGVSGIGEDGNLVLFDGNKDSVWSTNLTNLGSSKLMVKLLDSGNLVLGKEDDQDSGSFKFIWESFQNPTDTFLAGMKMNENLILTSWESPFNPADGDFQFQQEDNQYIIKREQSSYYFKSGVSGNFMSDDFLPIVSTLLSYGSSFYPETSIQNRTNMRLVINSNGTLQHFTRLAESAAWDSNWWEPRDRCSVFRTCGDSAICYPNNGLRCRCLPGFEPVSPESWSAGENSEGCRIKMPLCGSKQKALNFLPLEVIKVGKPEKNFKTNSEKQCREVCLKDCSCQAYSFTENTTCWIWKKLDNIQEGNTDGGRGIFLRQHNAGVNQTNQDGGFYETITRIKQWPLVIGVTVFASVTALVFPIVYIYTRKRKVEKQDRTSDLPLRFYDGQRHVKDLIDSEGLNDEDKKGIDLPFFDFESILAATDNFSEANKLGKGGFGPVYKGNFPGGQEIAVKRLSRISGQGDEKILLYEFMPNRSLDCFIFDPNLGELLDWEIRFNIILGIARGLLYLHQDSRLRIIHRDMKTSNILLDEEMNPKISDFGLARIFEGKQTEGRTNRVVGTYGYMSPEYALDGFFSVKSDVFSFGVVILEIISGKKNTGFYNTQEALSLLGYAWRLWQEDKALDLMDQRLGAGFKSRTHEILKCINGNVKEDFPYPYLTILPYNQPALLWIFGIIRCRIPHIFSFGIRLFGVSVQCHFFNNASKDNEGETLVSLGKTFELGFFTPNGSSDDRRYVGIWYYGSQTETVVWVANRDSPILDDSGVFATTEDGNLRVFDGSGRTYWSTDLGNSSSVKRTVKLMDSGNLVVSDEDHKSHLARTLWQSFDNPTDTFLPGMKMDDRMVLSSWRSFDDPTPGNFTFQLDQEEENQFIIWNRSMKYWKSSVSGKFIGSDEIPSTMSYLLSNFTSSVHNETVPYLNSSLYSDTRMIMSFSGQAQYFKWNSLKVWALIWAEPRDRCSVYNSCGNFGSCNSNNKLMCKCLPGFEPSFQEKWNREDFSGGCSRKSKICGKNAEGDTFLRLNLMNVGNPDSQFNAKNETECKLECLNNCQCQAYSYRGVQITQRGVTGSSSACLIWSEDINNLQEEYQDGGSLFVRVAGSDIETIPRNCETCGTNMIPYPLSTGPKCGDTMYFNFHCNITSGQVSFEAPGGVYRVTRINPETQKFVIQTNNEENCEGGNLRDKFLKLDQSSPFHVTGWCDVDSLTGRAEVEISWDRPPEPMCSSSEDCKSWPNSSCNKTGDGKTRCLCNGSFQWNSLSLNCTEGVKKRKVSLSLIIALASMSIVILVFLTIILYIYFKKRRVAKGQGNRRNIPRNLALHLCDSERRVKDLIDSGRYKEDDRKGSVKGVLGLFTRVQFQEDKKLL